MPYIGVSPPSAALTSSDITDNIITEAKMADDAISLTELKAGTDGEVISWDASGNPVAIGAGTSGHFLKSQGAGSQPVFAAASSDYVKIQTTTLGSGTAAWSVDGWIDDTTYKNYAIYVYNFSHADNGAWVYGRWNISGSTHTGTDYSYTLAQAHSGGSIDAQVSTSASYWRISTNSTTTSKSLSGQIILYDPTNTSFFHGHTQVFFGYDGATNFISTAGGGVLRSTSALTGITFYSSSGGNITAGSTVTIYGIKG